MMSFVISRLLSHMPFVHSHADNGDESNNKPVPCYGKRHLRFSE